jgi:hypothetical protein
MLMPVTTLLLQQQQLLPHSVYPAKRESFADGVVM